MWHCSRGAARIDPGLRERRSTATAFHKSHDYLSRRLQPVRTREGQPTLRGGVTSRGLKLAARVATRHSTVANLQSTIWNENPAFYGWTPQVKIPRALHSWSVTPRRAVAIQRELAGRIIRRGHLPVAGELRLLAGADVAFSPDMNECIAGVVVWEVQGGRLVEQHVIRRPVRFPYVPGLLSFREAPAVLAALRKLRCEPDAFLFDGQGLAHPRRFGLACHVGLLIDRPSVGCAKSLLVGKCMTPGVARGSRTRIEHDGECIGMAVRTRDNVKPVYVSIGHRLSLKAAVAAVLAGGGGYRIPEPTRLADRLVAREKVRA